MTTQREGFVDVEGGRIWYRIAGEGDGTALIVLHGGPGVSHEYLDPLAALGDERRIVFYDQLGAGKSDRPCDDALWTAGRFVRELEALRSDLRLDRAHILGQSWGTMLAVDHALAGATGIESLVLSSPCLSVSRWRDDADELLAAMPDAERTVISRARETGAFDSPAYQAAAFAYSKRHLCRLDPWPTLMSGSAGSVNRHVYAAVWGPTDFEATGDLRDYERADDLQRLTMPVLYLCGRYDGATPEATAWYQSLTPNTEMVVFEESSHVPHIEEPVPFLSVVRDFLRRADAR
jgi:proline iminopeptidase